MKLNLILRNKNLLLFRALNPVSVRFASLFCECSTCITSIEANEKEGKLLTSFHYRFNFDSFYRCFVFVTEWSTETVYVYTHAIFFFYSDLKLSHSDSNQIEYLINSSMYTTMCSATENDV